MLLQFVAFVLCPCIGPAFFAQLARRRLALAAVAGPSAAVEQALVRCR